MSQTAGDGMNARRHSVGFFGEPAAGQHLLIVTYATADATNQQRRYCRFGTRHADILFPPPTKDDTRFHVRSPPMKTLNMQQGDVRNPCEN
jgi:hypothetical protein